MTPATDDDPNTASVASNSSHDADGDWGDSGSPDVPDIPGILDWVLGGLVAIAGVLFAFAGLLLFTIPRRENVEAVVASEGFYVEGMTEPEFVEFTLSLLPWVAAGLLLTGTAMIVLGGAYIVHRRRVRDRAAAGEQTSDFLANALLGAVVSAVTSFIPFSTVIGGGLAGYLERGESERTSRVGAVSAVLLGAPFFVIGLFVAAGLVSGFAAIGDSGFGVVVAVVTVVGGLVSLGVAVAVGAVGGWIGGKLAG